MKNFTRLQIRYIVAPFVIGGLLLAVVFVFLFGLAGYGVSKRVDIKIAEVMAIPTAQIEQMPLEKNIALYLVQKDGTTIVQKSGVYQADIASVLAEKVLKQKNKAFAVDKARFMMSKTSYDLEGSNYTLYVAYDCTAEIIMLNDLSQITVWSYFLSIIILGICCYIMSVNAIRPIKEAYFKQRQLIADASHEIKTPITVVSANLELMASDPQSTIADNKKWLNSSQYQTKRMSNLILQLLELSSLEEGKFLKNYQRIDISEICLGVVLSFEAIAFEKKISVKSNIKDGLVAKGNAIEFEKLVTILFDNALKYTDISGEISLDLYKDGKLIVLKIVNSGEGIAQEKIPYIFERFYKLDNSHQEHGNSFGLGLSIAKTIAQNMKGDIVCTSEVSKWTCMEAKFQSEREKKQPTQNIKANKADNKKSK